MVTIQAVEYGLLLAERPDSGQGTLLREWGDHNVAEAFVDRALSVNEAVARQAAALHFPDPAPLRAALIGATALVHRMRPSPGT